MKKAAYWIACVGLIVLLWIGVSFLGMLTYEHHIKPQYFLAPIVVVIGLLILRSAVGDAGRLWDSVVRKPGTTQVRNWQPDSVGAAILGFGFVAGGVLYGITGAVGILVFSFAAAVVVIRVRGAIYDHWAAKQFHRSHPSKMN